MNWNPTLRLIRYPAVFLVAVLFLVACGGDDSDGTATVDPSTDPTSTDSTSTSTDSTAAPDTEPPGTSSTTVPPTTTAAPDDDETAGDPSTSTTEAESPSTTAGEAPGGQGIVTVRLQEVEGFFIEGFEIGLRFETATKDVIGATLWTDFVNSTGDSGIDAYYDSVLEQSVPAGTITVLATANVGIGPGPVIPDPNGPLDCMLTVEVPAGGQVDVEVGFDDENCLRQL